MRISGTEPSSVVFSQIIYFKSWNEMSQSTHLWVWFYYLKKKFICDYNVVVYTILEPL